MHPQSQGPVLSSTPWQRGQPIYAYHTAGDGFNGLHKTSLTPEYQRHAVAQIRDYNSRKGLDTEGEMVVVDRTLRGANEGTIREYHTMYQDVFTFACMIGDWRTATICCRVDEGPDRLCPHNPEPCEPDTLCKFMLYKTLPEGEELKFKGVFVRDINGNILRPREQQWHASCTVHKYQAAMKTLHYMYPTLHGKYVPECPACIDINKNNNSGHWRACHDHARTGPSIKPCGCPVESDIFNNENMQVRKRLDAKHIRKGSLRLLPGHIKTIYEYLTGKLQAGVTQNVWYLECWVLILVGIHLFLRASELLALKPVNIRKDGVNVEDGRVLSLVVEVETGKADVKPVLLKLYRNDKFTWFCPVRWLLFYINVAGIRHPDGALFPGKRDVEQMAAGKKEHTASTKSLQYTDYLKMMKHLIRSLFPRLLDNTINCTIGTHTLRYLGYLFAVWGTISNNLLQSERERSKEILQRLNRSAENYVNPLPIPCYCDIMSAARHTSMTSANYYIQGVTQIYWSIQEKNKSFRDLHVVPYWKNNYVGNDMGDLASLIEFEVRFQKPVHELALYFLQTDMKISSADAHRSMDWHLLRNLLTNRPSTTNQDDSVMQLLAGNIKAELMDVVRDQFARELEAARQAGIEEGKRLATSVAPSAMRRRPESQTTPSPPKRQRQSSQDDPPEALVTPEAARAPKTASEVLEDAKRDFQLLQVQYFISQRKQRFGFHTTR